MKKTTHFLFLALAGILAWSCIQPKDSEDYYLNANYSALAFQTAGNAPVTVTVKAFPVTWEVKSNDSWITVGDRTEQSFSVTVDDFDGLEDRKGSVVITSEGLADFTIQIQQLGAGASLPAKYQVMPDFLSAVISPNGRYVGSRVTEYDENDAPMYYPVILDIKTGEYKVFGPFTKAVYHLQDALLITDQGTLFIENGTSGGEMTFTIDGDAAPTQTAPGFSSPAKLVSSSLGGNVLVGWGAGSPEGHTYGPVKVVDGVYEALPIPELNYRGYEFSQGVLAKGVSANGEIIYGVTWDDNDAGMVYWDKEGKVRYVGEDVRYVREVTMVSLGEEFSFNLADGVSWGTNAGNASPNGKWIAGSFVVESLNDARTEINYAYYPAFFNTETQKTTIFRDHGGYGGVAVTDDGIGFTTSMGGYGSGPVFDIESETAIYKNFSEYVQDKFDIIVPSGIKLEYMCPDNQTLLGSFVVVTDMGASDCYYYVTSQEREK